MKPQLLNNLIEITILFSNRNNSNNGNSIARNVSLCNLLVRWDIVQIKWIFQCYQTLSKVIRVMPISITINFYLKPNRHRSFFLSQSSPIQLLVYNCVFIIFAFVTLLSSLYFLQNCSKLFKKNIWVMLLPKMKNLSL